MQTFKQFFFESDSQEQQIRARLIDGRGPGHDRYIANFDPMSFKRIDKSVTLKVDENRLLHSDEGPAYIKKFLDGNLFEEIWAKHGRMHRLDGPARQAYDSYSGDFLIQYYINGVHYTQEEFDEYVKGLKSKEDKELLGDLGQTFESVEHNSDEVKVLKVGDRYKWYGHNEIRKGIQYAKVKPNEYITVDSKGFLHSPNKPIIRPYLKLKGGDAIYYKEWFKHGLQHRLDGPANQQVYVTGGKEVDTEHGGYWINNVEYSKEEFDAYIKDMKPDEIDMLSDLGQTFD